MTLREIQQHIEKIYGPKDSTRGLDGTFMWLMEEVGELAAALRGGDAAQRESEFADVLAWLVTIANVAGVDLQSAFFSKYGPGCPGCKAAPCVCNIKEKP